MGEEEAQQLLQQMQALEAYYADLSQREGVLSGMLREAAAASDSLKAMAEGDSDALLPVGMGAYVPAALSAGSKIILNVGAGVAVEKDVASAAVYVEARIKEIDAAMRDNSARRQEAAARMEDGRARLSQMMQTGTNHV